MMEEKAVNEFMDVSESDILPKSYCECLKLGPEDVMQSMYRSLEDMNIQKIIKEATEYTKSIIGEVRKMSKGDKLKMDDIFRTRLNSLIFKVGVDGGYLEFKLESKTTKLNIQYDKYRRTIYSLDFVDGYKNDYYRLFYHIDNKNIIEYNVFYYHGKVRCINLNADLDSRHINSTIKVENGKVDFCGEEENVRDVISKILHCEVEKYTKIGKPDIFADLLFVLQTLPDKRDNIYCFFGNYQGVLASSENLYKHLNDNFFQYNKKEFVVTKISTKYHAVAATVFRDGRIMISDSSNIFGTPINGITKLKGFKNAEVAGYGIQGGGTCSYYSAVTASLIACYEKEELEQVYEKSKKYR